MNGTRVDKCVPLPLDRVRAAIEGWLRSHPEHFEGDPPLVVYTADEWRNRGESMCPDSVGTVIIEVGAFADLVRFDWLGADADALYDEFTDLLRCHGYVHELGYLWTLHLYPADAR